LRAQRGCASAWPAQPLRVGQSAACRRVFSPTFRHNGGTEQWGEARRNIATVRWRNRTVARADGAVARGQRCPLFPSSRPPPPLWSSTLGFHPGGACLYGPSAASVMGTRSPPPPEGARGVPSPHLSAGAGVRPRPWGGEAAGASLAPWAFRAEPRRRRHAPAAARAPAVGGGRAAGRGESVAEIRGGGGRGRPREMVCRHACQASRTSLPRCGSRSAMRTLPQRRFQSSQLLYVLQLHP